MSSPSFLRTPEAIAEWRDQLPADVTVALVVDDSALAACRSSCDKVVATTAQKGVDVVIDICEQVGKGEVWVKGEDDAANRALLLLCWTRPTHVFLTPQHRCAKMYKQLIDDLWFDTTVTEVDNSSSSS